MSRPQTGPTIRSYPTAPGFGSGRTSASAAGRSPQCFDSRNKQVTFAETHEHPPTRHYQSRRTGSRAGTRARKPGRLDSTACIRRRDSTRAGEGIRLPRRHHHHVEKRREDRRLYFRPAHWEDTLRLRRPALPEKWKPKGISFLL